MSSLQEAMLKSGLVTEEQFQKAMKKKGSVTIIGQMALDQSPRSLLEGWSIEETNK